MISPPSMQSMSSLTTSSEDSSVAPEDHIKVCVRIRPVVRTERDQGESLCWQWENNQIIQLDRPITKNLPNYPSITSGPRTNYYFDHLFYPEHTNRDIFDSVVKSVVNSVMNGFHGSVFTYGQTSSGKTFTMTGNSHQPGIIPQAINYCFDSIHSFQDREFLVRVSFLEIYNEQVKDLLNSEVVAIKIQHDPKNGTTITGVKEQVVVNSEQTISLIKAGEAHRHVGSTDMNEKSSRAHTLFKLTIESRERHGSSVPPSSSGYSPVRVSTLNLVDLAGSENAKQTNSKGERALEARYINQSLLTLSTIIHKLSEEKPGMTPLARRQHLPYRDSKLTRILQPSLDGNAQIAVICTISPVQSCVEETNNTLKFATRAKSVKMNAKVNDVMDEKTLLKVYREEIEQLKAKLFELEMQSKLYAESPLMRTRSRNHLEEDDDEQEMLLQMITEMESMILKADSKRQLGTDSSSGLSTPTGIAPNVSNNVKPTTFTPPSTLPSKQEAPSPGIAIPVEPSSSSVKSNLSTVSKNSRVTTDSLSNSKLPKTPVKPIDKRGTAPTPVDKKVTTLTEKGKSRFGFGFGFKSKTSSGSPTPESVDGTSTPEHDGMKSKSQKKEVVFDNNGSNNHSNGNSNHSHDHTPPNGHANDHGSQDESDYNSVDGHVDRSSMLDRQSSIINRVQSFRGDDVGDKVLFGVSKMLAALKIHIGKSRGQTNTVSTQRKSSADTDSVNSLVITDVSVQAKIDRLELDLRLKEADNRFLQEELEKKDKMLAMLTEGLREVESSQQEWLATNQELSDDLEKALMNNAWLAQELVRLQGLLTKAGVDLSLVQSTPPPRSPRKDEEY